MSAVSNNINKLARFAIERMAREAICACWYYELIDNIETTSTYELLEIISGNFYCSNCDGGKENE
jgi:hypothetical protein